jgi:hypothetical protein
MSMVKHELLGQGITWFCHIALVMLINVGSRMSSPYPASDSAVVLATLEDYG